MALLSPKKIAELHSLYGRPVTIDDVIRLRASDEVQCPILAHPRADSLTNYELFTGRDIDQFVDQACWTLVDNGFKANDTNIIALYAHSDLSFSITMLALLRLGYKVMTISTRLGHPACRSLLNRVECKTIIHGAAPRLCATIDAISSDRPDMNLYPILSRSDFDKPDATWKPFIRQRSDNRSEQRRIALIMHSSGSTGYPKPLFQCHAGVLTDLLTGMGCKAFNPLPWFHLHGLLTSLQAMWMRKTAYLWNARLPLTADSIVTALRAVKPEVFHGVPYTVKLLSEVPEGMELLRNCKYVTAGGARPPDELGDKLIKEGVHFATTFGLTETGHIGDSIRRKPGDDAWGYLRLHSHVIPHIIFEKVEHSKYDNTYEAVFLKSHPCLLMSNSNSPPGSYRSGDMFIAHSTIPHAWKYLARKDDNITLANGEKINPMAIEGVLRDHPLIRDALMFGVDQALPGIMIFQSSHAAHMSDEEYMTVIAPALEEANSFADDFARVTSDMVVLVSPSIQYPVTDKNNIIRAAAYRIFDKEIRAAYSENTNGRDTCNGQTDSKVKLQFDIPQLEHYIIQQFKVQAKVNLEVTDDFFSAGVDSLIAIQIRRSLLRDIDIGGAGLPTNVIYDSRNASRLAKLLYSMRTGEGAARGNSHNIEAQAIQEMKNLIEKYSTFSPRTGRKQLMPQDDVVVLTGATGALGAHLLHILLHRPSVRHIYCLVRSLSKDPRERVLESLRQRGIDIAKLETTFPDKFSAYHTSNFGDANLGLPVQLYSELQRRTTLIVHAAWPVHFQLSLASFESYVSGTRNLLDLALQTPWTEPARMLFASSISTAYATPRLLDSSPAVIAEGPIPSLSHCLGIGYARSKLVCERICERAAGTGMKVGVLRIGQIVGDVEKGIWNSKESIPLMIHSALVTHTLPKLDGEQGLCDWMPVDIMAEACLQVDDTMTSRTVGMNRHRSLVNRTSNNGSHATYFNIVSPHTHTWNADVLPALKQSGLQFEIVPFSTWLANVESHSAKMGETAGQQLPASKLIHYYKDLYGNPSGRTSLARFDVSRGSDCLPALRNCPNVVASGLVEKFVGAWTEVWSR